MSNKTFTYMSQQRDSNSRPPVYETGAITAMLCRHSYTKQKKKSFSTYGSRVVPHLSTRQAQWCLTSEFGWDLVFPPWYDRMTITICIHLSALDFKTKKLYAYRINLNGCGLFGHSVCNNKPMAYVSHLRIREGVLRERRTDLAKAIEIWSYWNRHIWKSYGVVPL